MEAIIIELIKQKFRGLGTVITLSVAPPANQIQLQQAEQMINRYEDTLTVNRDQSEVMNINHQAGIAPVQVSESTYELIKTAVQVSRKHLGFNVAIGPLVKLWKFGFDGANKPSEEAIKNCLQLINPDAIELSDEDHSVYLKFTGMELDLGGIAKGYIADAVKQMCIKNGVHTGIIDLGGNVLLVGNSIHDNQMWNVGVQNPVKDRHIPIGILHIPEKSIGTSGIYERKLVIDGHEYHHMFDSLTGYPIANDLASVTIVSNQSIDGEIWSTIAFYQGIDHGKELIEAEPGVEAIFIKRDLSVEVTSGLTESFQLTTSLTS